MEAGSQGLVYTVSGNERSLGLAKRYELDVCKFGVTGSKRKSLTRNGIKSAARRYKITVNVELVRGLVNNSDSNAVCAGKVKVHYLSIFIPKHVVCIDNSQYIRLASVIDTDNCARSLGVRIIYDVVSRKPELTFGKCKLKLLVFIYVRNVVVNNRVYLRARNLFAAVALVVVIKSISGNRYALAFSPLVGVNVSIHSLSYKSEIGNLK